tara:strand:+ start:17188 stop:17922 length:735 start_codon:yes stop_codon:yes gene_type:complete
MKIFEVENKVCVITGAGRGIGLNLAKSLYDLGAFVVGLDVKFDSPSKSGFKKIKIDLQNDKDIEEVTKSIVNYYKKVDVLINCAGVTIPSEKEYKLIDWKTTFDVNVTAPFLLMKHFKEGLTQSDSPSVINITSLNAKLAFPNNPAYVASKSALAGLTRSFALDYGKLGIRVNNVAPGYIKTDMTGESWTDESKRKKRQERTMLGRWGSVQDLVGPVVFLASDASSYITGQTIYVDGGWSVKGF